MGRLYDHPAHRETVQRTPHPPPQMKTFQEASMPQGLTFEFVFLDASRSQLEAHCKVFFSASRFFCPCAGG